MQPMSQTKHNRTLSTTSDGEMKCAQFKGIFPTAQSPGTEQGMQRLTLEQ